jgi:PDZ domain-containing protein
VNLPRLPRPPLRSALLGASLALVATAMLVVPMPFVEYRPGDAIGIDSLVVIDGVDTTELDGTAAMLTVVARQQPLAPLVVAWIDPSRRLLPAGDVYPRDIDRRTYLASQRERFSRQFEAAAAVGARTAGYDVDLITEVVVTEVVAGAPADGVIAPGDSILAVDGRRLASSEELQATVRATTPGTELRLTVEHAGSEREVVIAPLDLDGSGVARLGVVVQTAIDGFRLPFAIALSEQVRIGGPSAGMMIGLTVYDLLADEDLLAGRFVAGSGSLDVDGRVGPVGAIPEKVRTAIAAGADIVLVPLSQRDEALAAAGDRVVVIGVETLDEAIAALRAAG